MTEYKEETLVRAFLNENTLSCGKIIKYTHGETESIELNISLEGGETICFEKIVNSEDKGDLPEVYGLMQFINLFIEELKKREEDVPAIITNDPKLAIVGAEATGKVA